MIEIRVKNIRSRELYDLAIRCGYDKCGIITIDATADYAIDLDKRIENYSDSRSFYEDYYAWANMKKQYSWGKSILICGYWYGKYRVPSKLKKHYGRSYLMDGRLDKNCDEYKARVLLESGMKELGIRFYGDRLEDIVCFRMSAQKAGLGIIRKNNFLYTEKGSWTYFDAWVLGEELEFTHEVSLRPCPVNCDLCQKACKTGTLCKANTMNPYFCTAFVSTLNTDGLQDNPIAPEMQQWIYGCDDCQNACPFNQAVEEYEDFPLLSELSATFSPEYIILATDEELKQKVQTKFWYIGSYEIWKFRVNALNALANAETKPDNFIALLNTALQNSAPQVREMAIWVKEKLNV